MKLPIASRNIAGRPIHPTRPDSPCPPKEEFPNGSWDVQCASAAAKKLFDSVPAMISHWDRLRWAPETCGGYQAIKTLEAALSLAMPYIEWPFGFYKSQT